MKISVIKRIAKKERKIFRYSLPGFMVYP